MNNKMPNKSEYKVGQAFEKQGVKVVYQHPCGPYLLDIYLPKYNACIEIYGPHHIERGRMVTDQIRQRYIEELGIYFYVISANDANIEYEVNRLVRRVIEEALKTIKPKAVSSFNDMKDQLSQWIDAHGTPQEPSSLIENPTKITAINPQKAPEEDDFATMLERYLPKK